MRNFILTLMLLLCASTSMMAAQKKIVGNVVPEGTPSWYTMDAYLQTSQGTVMHYGLTNQISFSNDGRSAFFKTLFPAQYAELWVMGAVNGNRITIDSKAVVGVDTYTTDEGRETYELKVGEPIFDISDNIIGVKDITFLIDGERIYIDDNQQSPDHAIALYGEDKYGIQLFDWTFCDSFKPYNGPTQTASVPTGVDIKSYVYDYKDTHLNPATHIGHLAVDGDTYYFDSLVPGIEGWTIGIRTGNEVKVERKQLLAFEPQIFYLGGYLQSDGGRLSDIIFDVDADGNLKQQNKEQFIVAYQTNGSLVDYGREFNIRRFDDGVAFCPSAPTEVHAVYFDELHQHGIEFYQDNRAEDGSLISADQLGYYIYVDGRRFTFNRSQYPYIKWNSTQFIPFGYCDDYNNGDIFCDGIYNCVLFYFENYETLGVQSVYRSGDVETRSDIITVDRYNIIDIVPDGINNAATEPAVASPSWYDLHGRQLNGEPTHGVFVVDGRKVIVK